MIEHVGAIGRQRQLEERSGKRVARLDQGEHAARREVDALQRAANLTDDLADQPVIFTRVECGIDVEHRLRVRQSHATDDRADLRLVDPQPQNRIVQLAEGAERPRLVAGRHEFIGGGRLRRVRRADRQIADAAWRDR